MMAIQFAFAFLDQSGDMNIFSPSQVFSPAGDNNSNGHHIRSASAVKREALAELREGNDSSTANGTAGKSQLDLRIAQQKANIGSPMNSLDVLAESCIASAEKDPFHRNLFSNSYIEDGRTVDFSPPYGRLSAGTATSGIGSQIPFID